ncbi:unnamed protein product [Protopolystoma xenopodis]|uniref:Uncharacterized protein n=1 Tax=Protopolystoma xenopodis TaxID=117903 RepID=A0A448XE60_9PLAT|nr:unnamed protein product [Protopolystoma xenopodis]
MLVTWTSNAGAIVNLHLAADSLSPPFLSFGLMLIFIVLLLLLLFLDILLLLLLFSFFLILVLFPLLSYLSFLIIFIFSILLLLLLLLRRFILLFFLIIFLLHLLLIFFSFFYSFYCSSSPTFLQNFDSFSFLSFPHSSSSFSFTLLPLFPHHFHLHHSFHHAQHPFSLPSATSTSEIVHIVAELAFPSFHSINDATLVGAASSSSPRPLQTGTIRLPPTPSVCLPQFSPAPPPPNTLFLPSLAPSSSFLPQCPSTTSALLLLFGSTRDRPACRSADGPNCPAGTTMNDDSDQNSL